MNEDQLEDTKKRTGSLSSYSNADIQKAWDMLSKHNSELLLENYQLKEQLQKSYHAGVLRAIKWKISNLFRGRYE